MEGQVFDSSKFAQLKELKENIVESSFKCIKALEKELELTSNEILKANLENEIINAKIKYEFRLLDLKKHLNVITNDEENLVILIQKYEDKKLNRKPTATILKKLRESLTL